MVTVRERVRIFTPELQLRTRTGQGYNSAGEAEARVRHGRICVLFSTFVKIFFSFKVQAPPAPWALELETLETVTQQSVASVTASGPDATPALLGALDQASSGQALLANLALLRHNGVLASSLASEHLKPLHHDR